MKKKIFLLILLSLCHLILFPPASAQAGLCALCRHALEQSGNRNLMTGFYWSILLIAGVPLAIMTIAGAVFLRAWFKYKKLHPRHF